MASGNEGRQVDALRFASVGAKCRQLEEVSMTIRALFIPFVFVVIGASGVAVAQSDSTAKAAAGTSAAGASAPSVSRM
ncbi:MAG: hypothetical protein M3Z16_08930, partial [Pseudomonadota bacterium]|nr:hypothetical protein [Pseudomonadota bacterium]